MILKNLTTNYLLDTKIYYELKWIYRQIIYSYLFPVCLFCVDVECLRCPALSVFSGSPVMSVSLSQSPALAPTQHTPHSTLVSCGQSLGWPV